MRRVEMEPGSIMLAHMITMKHLPAFAQGLGQIFRGGKGRTVILLLRYQAGFYDSPACAKAFRELERLARKGHAIRLASDSGRLADQIGLLTSLPVEVLPIPHTPPDAAAPAGEVAAAPRERLRFASLGNARDEKGYFEILQAIRILQMDPDGLDGLEFWLQSNHPAPDVSAAIEAFARDQPPEVTLVHEGLDEAAYHAALMAADVVMVPYWRSIYEARTSGVLLEALAAGKPVIATQDTWMSDELELHGAGILVPDQDPLDLADAIRRMAREHADFAARAMADRGAVLARHSAAALVAQCAGPQPPRRPGPPPRRLAVFYPWDDVMANRGGASLRVNMMLNMLAPRVERVDVLQQGQSPPAQRGNIFVESAGRRGWHENFYKVLRFVTWPFLGRAGQGQELLLWYHLERLPALRFRKRVEEMVAASDAVLLEYSFHAPMVLAAARRHRKPVILSQYDVLSAQVRNSAVVRRLTLDREVAALRDAPHAFTVSEADHAVFAAEGVASRIVPNPVDLVRSQVSLPVDARRVLEEAYGLSLPTGPLAIFVGSRFTPNIVAAGHMRRLARLCPGIGFIVAGGCMEPMEARNFRALGVVEEAALIALYRAAAVVLVPLESGSGSSLKTVEAMAAGVPVLGTPVAFRGLAVMNGVHCLVEADMMQWPGRIVRLLSDRERAARIGQAGRALAGALDYRRVFQAYTETLDLPERGEGTEAELLALETSLVAQIRAAAAARGATELLADLPPDPEALLDDEELEATQDEEAELTEFGWDEVLEPGLDEMDALAGELTAELVGDGPTSSHWDDLEEREPAGWRAPPRLPEHAPPRAHPTLHEAVLGALGKSRLQLALARHLLAFEPPPELEELPVPEAFEELEEEIEGLIGRAEEHRREAVAQLARPAEGRPPRPATAVAAQQREVTLAQTRHPPVPHGSQPGAPGEAPAGPKPGDNRAARYRSNGAGSDQLADAETPHGDKPHAPHGAMRPISL